MISSKWDLTSPWFEALWPSDWSAGSAAVPHLIFHWPSCCYCWPTYLVRQPRINHGLMIYFWSFLVSAWPVCWFSQVCWHGAYGGYIAIFSVNLPVPGWHCGWSVCLYCWSSALPVLFMVFRCTFYSAVLTAGLMSKSNKRLMIHWNWVAVPSASECVLYCDKPGWWPAYYQNYRIVISATACVN